MDFASVQCYCSGHCPGGVANGTCITKPGGYCYAFVQEVVDLERNRLEKEFSYGCLPPHESGYMQCMGDLSPHAIPRSIQCCRDFDLCNKFLKPEYKSSQTDVTELYSFSSVLNDQQLLLILSVIGGVLFLLIGITLLVLMRLRINERRKKGSCEQSIADSNDDLDSFDSRFVPRENTGCIGDITNSSGAKVLLLVDRTVSRDLGRNKLVARGRYGQVSVVELRGAKVAMKEFSTTEEMSWKREVAIYTTPLLRHENILGFIAADIRGSCGVTKMLLLTEFHEKGSLFDFLSVNVLDQYTAHKFMLSIASGLSHLHIEIVGHQSKPAIAHRDIKSKNILVKNDLSCCIADFGLSVTYASSKGGLDIGDTANVMVGTKRYMAPEILDQSLNVYDFESYKRADMYAFALVTWEILNRMTDGETYNEYQVPYHGLVPSDPSFEEMKKLVCDQRIRPKTDSRWGSAGRLMREAWNRDPTVRPSAFKAKKELMHVLKLMHDTSGRETLSDNLRSIPLMIGNDSEVAKKHIETARSKQFDPILL